MSKYYKKYSCINCGSVFEPSLRAEFEHIKVLCAFCDYAAALVPIPDWETPEQWKERTGKEWPEEWAVYFRMCADKFGGFTAYTYKDALRLYDIAIAHTGITPKYQIVCATEAGPPPDNWEQEGRK